MQSNQPARIIAIYTPSHKTKTRFLQGVVTVGSRKQQVYLGCVPQAVVGDHVLIESGIATAIISHRKVQRLIAASKALSDQSVPTAKSSGAIQTSATMN